MLIVTASGYPFHYDHKIVRGAFNLRFDQIPPLKGCYIGPGGGFQRKVDAEIAIRSLRNEWPQFDWDCCNYEQWIAFMHSEGEEKIKRISMQDLQW